MDTESKNKLKTMLQAIPSGLLVDDAWFERGEYSHSLVDGYVSGGWLENPAPGVYRMPGGSIRWQQVVISMQALMRIPVAIGGRTALQMEEFTSNHLRPESMREVHIYGYGPAPNWLLTLPCEQIFTFHDSGRLFTVPESGLEPPDLDTGMNGIMNYRTSAYRGQGFTQIPWGEYSWPMTMSSQARSILEVIDELPDPDAEIEVDKVMNRFLMLDPDRLNAVLRACVNADVKNQFLRYAERHNYNWLKMVDMDAIGAVDGSRRAFTSGSARTKIDSAAQENINGLH